MGLNLSNSDFNESMGREFKTEFWEAIMHSRSVGWAFEARPYGYGLRMLSRAGPKNGLLLDGAKTEANWNKKIFVSRMEFDQEYLLDRTL